MRTPASELKAEERQFLRELARAYVPPPRSAAEHRAFDARLRERLARAERRLGWAPAASLIAAATAVLALCAVPTAPPQVQSSPAAGMAVLLATMIDRDSRFDGYELPEEYALLDSLLDDPADDVEPLLILSTGDPR